MSNVPPPFKKILIANRGEIACRIIRTAQRMGIECLAIYSDADRNALHVQCADRAYHIGLSSAEDSYLNAKKILTLAKEQDCDAIHPGYGFLSENADFAQQCEKHNIIFIGPPSSAIKKMGSKSIAKDIATNAGVPTVPGYCDLKADDNAYFSAAKKMGFPLLIKAVAGGGGKGMKIVSKAADFMDALHSARREAAVSFSDDSVLLEQYIPAPRHIEVQVFADQHGAAVHLFERECSIQRRYQKIIEEAPAPSLSAALREALTTAAVNITKAVSYIGAGTVEFLVEESGAFYFMEMNTRLQVEHPVTECITGTDLVEWQLRVAAGEPLPLSQKKIVMQGHAIEARLYAENPDHDFLPSIGPLRTCDLFSDLPSLRVDTGVKTGDYVSLFYDPMLAKIIAQAPDRKTALTQLSKALECTFVSGVNTNLPLLFNVLHHPVFLKGKKINTHFLTTHRSDLFPTYATPNDTALVCAAMVLLMHDLSQSDSSPWSLGDQWRLNQPSRRTLSLQDDQKKYPIEIALLKESYRVHSGANHYNVQMLPTDLSDSLHISIDGDPQSISFNIDQHRLTLCLNNRFYQLTCGGDATTHTATHPVGDKRLTSPMPGRVAAVNVQCNDRVNPGDVLIVIEAMKMEHAILAPAKAKVDSLNVRQGDLVAEGDVLLELI